MIFGFYMVLATRFGLVYEGECGFYRSVFIRESQLLRKYIIKNKQNRASVFSYLFH